MNRLQVEIDQHRRYCESIFIDPADLLACDDDRGVPALEQKLLYLSAALEVTGAMGSCAVVNCNCTNFGNFFQPLVDSFNSNTPLDKTWQQIMDESLEASKQEYACVF